MVNTVHWIGLLIVLVFLSEHKVDNTNVMKKRRSYDYIDPQVRLDLLSTHHQALLHFFAYNINNKYNSN